MHVDIESTAELEAHLATHGDLRSVVVQALDLRGLTDRLRVVSGRGATFLGCRLDPSGTTVSSCTDVRPEGALLGRGVLTLDLRDLSLAEEHPPRGVPCRCAVAHPGSWARDAPARLSPRSNERCTRTDHRAPAYQVYSKGTCEH